MPQHQLVPLAQHGRPLLGSALAPGWLGCMRGLDRPSRFRGTHVRHAAQSLTIGRVANSGAGSLIGLAPVTVDIGLLAEQGGGLQFHDHLTIEHASGAPVAR